MKWFKLATRENSIQHNQILRSGWLCNNSYYSLKNSLSVPLGKRMANLYFVKYEWKKLMKVLAKEFYKGPLSLPRHLKKYKVYKNQLLKKARVFNKDLSNYSAKKLFLLYKDLVDEFHRYLFFGWSPWALNSEIDPLFKKLLKKKYIKEWKDIYNAVATPTKYNEITLQLIKLLKMEIEGRLQAGLKKHIKQYQWLPIYDFVGSPWKKKDFLNQLKEIKNPKEELTRLETALKKNRDNFELAIEKLRADKKLLNMAKLINAYVWLRTDRVDVARKALFNAQGFYRELERRIGFKNQESIWMTSSEIENFLLNEKIDKEKIKKRAQNGCMLYIKNGKERIISDSEEMKKIIKKELEISQKLPKIFKGTVASRGIAKGKVTIIESRGDISKMKKNNILVASMTLQEYMPAIIKAAAIITDEGGITCHAAIVSRELNKPCIIGTKIATKVLKDGDFVEVDANKGVIRILKKK